MDLKSYIYSVPDKVTNTEEQNTAIADKISSLEKEHNAKMQQATLLTNEVIHENDTNKDAFEEDDSITIAYEINTQDVLTIDKIVDTQGYLSAKVNEILNQYNVRIIPVEAAGVLTQVSELSEHLLTEIAGVKYAYSTEINKELIKRYRDLIYDTLSAGLPYNDSLSTKIETKSGDIMTFKLIPPEWNYLCSVFRNYNPRLVLTKGELHLMVG